MKTGGPGKKPECEKWDDMDPRGPSTREVEEYQACLERQRQRRLNASK